MAVAAAAAVGAAAPAPAAAQRPPPRPKISSVPIECKQAGGCAMDDDMNAGMAKFKPAGGTSEVLDAKNGKYSTGMLGAVERFTGDCVSRARARARSCFVPPSPPECW